MQQLQKLPFVPNGRVDRMSLNSILGTIWGVIAAAAPTPSAAVDVCHPLIQQLWRVGHSMSWGQTQGRGRVCQAVTLPP